MPARLLLRAAFGVAERLAPGTAARYAARLWFTVPAARPSTTPAPGGATEFAVDLPEGEVVGRSWGQGPAVYFMHGWGGDAGHAHAFVEPLVARGMRVVTFDAPGHGRSSRRRRTHAAEFARALEAVQESQGRAYAVIAHSLGAVALMVSMRSSGTSPDRIVLVAPLARVDGQLDRLAGLLGLGPRTRASLDEEVRSTTGLTVAELGLVGLTRSYPGIAALVVHDRGDTFAPYDDTAALVAGWADAQLVTTQGLGHVRLLAAPEVVAVAVEGLTHSPVAAGGD